MNSQDSKKNIFYIHTLGCKVNQYESQAMRESLLSAGFEESHSRDVANVYIINTCTVTEKADKESRYMISALARSNPDAKIVVTGCYVEEDAKEIAAMPGISHIVRNSDKASIAGILKGALTAYGLQPTAKDAVLPKITGFKGHVKAFVKIQDGCDNLCAYCKVPFVRGPSKSRPLDDILAEAEGLVNNGFKEIILTGICLGAWGRDFFPARMAEAAGITDATLVDVLKALGRIAGDFRIRLSSIEPKHVTDRLMDFIRLDKRMCRHLHIPLQSGDGEILKKMNRPYTPEEYMALADKIRAGMEGVAITTDVMVGFPGETDVNFENTLNFVRALSPARTHIFTFSKRPGTAACGLDGGVDHREAKRRHREMELVALNASCLYAKTFIGKVAKVLVESDREKDPGLLTGYSDNYIKVLFSGPDDLMKHIVPVRITSADQATIIGVYEG